MHEISLMGELIRLVEEEAAGVAGGGRVLAVKISVGPLSCASAEALRFAFDSLAPGTGVEGAELDIAEPPLVCTCDKCGACVEVDGPFSLCPLCGAEKILFEGSDAVRVESIELEDEGAPDP